MIILSLDFETTGLDTANDRVIEGGAVLWSTAQHRILEAADFLVKPGIPIGEEVTKLTGITPDAVEAFGFESRDSLDNVLAMAAMADALAGQNILRFDKKVLINWMNREGFGETNPVTELIRQKLTIDTLFDIPGVEGRKLQYMLADHMRLNPFPHSALADALSVIILLEEHTAGDGNIDSIIERAKSPLLIIQSLHPRNMNAEAKKPPFRFRWCDQKIWWKEIKQIDLEEFKKTYPFEIAIRTDLTRDDLGAD